MPAAPAAGPGPVRPPVDEPGATPAPAGEWAIETKGLTKAYRGGRRAVDGLDLAVPRGSVFGFLGPNGCGKTTTIRMLLGLIGPTAGRARVLGQSMPAAGRRVLPRVGALIEGPALYGFLSGRDNLRRSTPPTRPPIPGPARRGSAGRWSGWAWPRRPARRRAPTPSA